MTAMRMRGSGWRAAILLALAAGWSAAGYFLWQTRVPDDLTLPRLSVTDYFSEREVARAEHFERFHYVSWILSTLALLGVLVYYAARGARFTRESAAGPIGTGMLLAMLGFALVWLVQLPFAIAENWWSRRYGVSEVGYVELIFGGWLMLGFVFVSLCLAVLIVMGLARLLGDRWWIVGGPVFVGLALLFAFASPYLVTDTHPIRDERLAAQVRELARAGGVEDVPVVVEDVDKYTQAANAYTTGLGPSRKVFLWNTLLDGRFSRGEVRFVVAHEFAHQTRDHIWKSVAWYSLFAIPGAYLIAVATRRRGGMARPEAVPVALLVLAMLALAATPLENVISRHMEQEADWVALETTRTPRAAAGLFEEFAETSLGDPSPPGWVYVWLDTHPTFMQRIAMAEAWSDRNPTAPRER